MAQFRTTFITLWEIKLAVIFQKYEKSRSDILMKSQQLFFKIYSLLYEKITIFHEQNLMPINANLEKNANY